MLHYWAKEILHAMKDLVHKTTYQIKNKITLDNIYVFDSGLGLYIDGIEFSEECEETKQAFRLYEGKIMKNYAQIILDIIYANQSKLTKEEIFTSLKEICDPVLYYIIWFMFNENKKRKAEFLKEYEKEIKENTSQATKTSTSKKSQVKLKGEETKKKQLSMHTMAQHRYFTLFEESTDLLLEEYGHITGESTGAFSVAV